MIENINDANASRGAKLHNSASNLRRMTASSRSGQTFVDGQKLTVIGGLLPDVCTIDGSDTQYLAYDCHDGSQLSYKTIFGKRVVLDKLPDGVTAAPGLHAKIGDQTVEVFLVPRANFKPRTTGNITSVTKVTADGDSMDVLKDDTTLTVKVVPCYVTVLPEGIKQQPSGSYYCRKADAYAVFTV